MSNAEHTPLERELLNEANRWVNGSNICICGDWRSDHERLEGRCKICAWDGPIRCEKFKFSAVATPEERKRWEMYHARP